MAFTKTNKELHIDLEAVATLAMVKKGLLLPVTELMDSKTAKEVDKTGLYKGKVFPFSFILAPSGKRNKKVLSSLEAGEQIDLVCDGKKRGELTVKEVFSIDPKERVYNIYGSSDSSHLGVANILGRLGTLAVCGDYTIEFEEVNNALKKVAQAKIATHAKHITGLVMAARPFHRVHEYIIRQSLDGTDLLVIFVTKPYLKDVLPFALRYEAVDYFVKHYLPAHKVVVVPLENTYIFAGENEMILDSIVVSNFGCNRFVVGQNHLGLGVVFSQDGMSSVLDNIKDERLEVKTTGKIAYCNECKSLVAVHSCPHGHHHHINYHSDSILTLLLAGIVPPPVLMRKEISALMLSKLFPNRFSDLARIFYEIVPSDGLIEEQSEEQLYMELIKLYQKGELV